MSFLEAFVNRIASEQIATFGQDMFEGEFPTNAPDRCLVVLEGVGSPPSVDLPIRYPGIQVISRGTSYPEAKTLIEQVFGLFHAKLNYQLGDYYVLQGRALQEPGDIGEDEKGRKRLSCNFGFILRGD